MDAYAFLDKCRDEEGIGLYIDAPWPDDGDKYRHKFTNDDQRRLATKLSAFEKTRVVIRYGDHPLIRELYPEGLRWTWRLIAGRTQTNAPKREVLIMNGRSRAGDPGIFKTITPAHVLDID